MGSRRAGTSAQSSERGDRQAQDVALHGDLLRERLRDDAVRHDLVHAAQRGVRGLRDRGGRDSILRVDATGPDPRTHRR